MISIEYDVRPETKTVICYINGVFYNKPIIGTAKCCPSDQFDENIGKQIAYKRAMIRLKEYDTIVLKGQIDFFQRKVDHYTSSLEKANKRTRELYDEIKEIIGKQYKKEK